MVHLPVIIGAISFGLSHAMILPEQITNLATLMVAPEKATILAAENVRGAKVDLLTADRQLHEALTYSATSLRPIGDKDSLNLAESLLGYHDSMSLKLRPEIREKRLQIYRNAVYSSLVDLARKYPATAGARFEAVAESLGLALKEQLLEKKLLGLKPMGDPKMIEEINREISHAIQILKNKHQDKLAKARQEISQLEASIFNFEGFQYSTTEQINNALKQTNVAGAPEAILIGDSHEHLLSSSSSAPKLSQPPAVEKSHARQVQRDAAPANYPAVDDRRPKAVPVA